MSPLALCLGILLIAVLCKTKAASGSARRLHQLEDILEAVYPLERAYRRESSEGLSVELNELAEECQRLLTLHPTSSSVPKLMSVISTSLKSEPLGNIAAISKGYSKSPSRLRRKSGGYDEEDEADDDAAVNKILRQVADGLRDGHQKVRALPNSPDAKAALIKSFDRIAKAIERKYSLTFHRTTDGLPLGFLPASTTSQQAFELASLAWLRAVDECDKYQEDGIAWVTGDWWRVFVIWLLHAAQYGARDPVTGLAFDFSGRPYHPLRPTLLAHRDHSRPFLEGTEAMTLEALSEADIDVLAKANGTVQSWHLNRFIGSSNIASLLATFEHSRTGSKALLNRLVAGGLVNASPEVVADIGQPGSLAISKVRYLLRNGKNERDVVDDVEVSVD